MQRKTPRNVKLAVLTAFLASWFSYPILAYANTMQERHNVGGYINDGLTQPYEFKASSTPTPLSEVEPATKDKYKVVISRAEKYFETYPATTAILLLDDGKILFEKYQGMGNPNAEFFSMSIGKSLTSTALGMAICNGHIESLQDRASKYLPEMKDSLLGQSTIHQLLTMSSGAYKPSRGGQPSYLSGIGQSPLTGRAFGGHSWPIRLGQASIAELLWGKWWKRVENKNVNRPGEVFSYKSHDTLTVSKIIERQTGMSSAAYFDKTVWQEINAEKNGHWESDKDGSTAASSGFQASLRDWARIGYWIAKHHEADSCIGRYLRSATSGQIPMPNARRVGYDSYGYQWWTEPRFTYGFWGLGYAGQNLAIDPKNRKVLLKFGYEKVRGSTGEMMRIFKQWVDIGANQ